MPVRQPDAGVEFIPRTGIYEFGYSSEIPLKLLEGKEGTSHILFLCVYEGPLLQCVVPQKPQVFPLEDCCYLFQFNFPCWDQTKPIPNSLETVA